VAVGTTMRMPGIPIPTTTVPILANPVMSSTDARAARTSHQQQFWQASTHALMTEAEGADIARRLGLKLGGKGHPFASNSYDIKGLYAYRSGSYAKIAFFGRGAVSKAQQQTHLAHPKYRPTTPLSPGVTAAAGRSARRNGARGRFSAASALRSFDRLESTPHARTIVDSRKHLFFIKDPVGAVRRACRARNTHFVDDEFVAGRRETIVSSEAGAGGSAYFDYEATWKSTRSTWIRPHSFCESPRVVVGGVGATDLCQSEQFGNSRLMSIIAAVAAKYPEIIQNAINPIDVSPEGVYSVRLCVDGQMRYILVDDMFPCDRDKDGTFRPVGARSRERRELWPLILEKALAKWVGCYENLCSESAAVNALACALVGGTQFRSVACPRDVSLVAGKVITESRAAAAARLAGLSLGGHGYPFASPTYTPKGLYAYSKGHKYANCAFFGTGAGSLVEQTGPLSGSKYRVPVPYSSIRAMSKLFDQLQRCEKSGEIALCRMSKPKNEVVGRWYGLLGAYRVYTPGASTASKDRDAWGYTRLILIRNTYEHSGTWTGEWGARSPFWKQFPHTLRLILETQNKTRKMMRVSQGNIREAYADPYRYLREQLGSCCFVPLEDFAEMCSEVLVLKSRETYSIAENVAREGGEMALAIKRRGG